MFSDEALWTRVWRRCRTIGLVLSLLLLGVACAPVAVPVLWVMDRLRRCPPVAVRAYMCLAVYVTLELVGVFLALRLVVLRWLGPLRAFEPFQVANYRLQWRWANWQLQSACWLYKLRLEVSDAAVVSPGPVLVFIRHVSMPDTLLPPAILSLPHDMRLRYVVKDALRYDPCLDIVGHNTPNAFVSRGADKERDVRMVQRLCEGLGPSDGITIFPEGTRFTPAKRARVIARFREKGDEAAAAYAESLHHVLPPRLGGALALLEHAPDADVVFVGHVGMEGAATLGDLWQGCMFDSIVQVGCWRVPRAAVPEDEAGRREWLMAEWQRLDRWVGERSA